MTSATLVFSHLGYDDVISTGTWSQRRCMLHCIADCAFKPCDASLKVNKGVVWPPWG